LTLSAHADIFKQKENEKNRSENFGGALFSRINPLMRILYRNWSFKVKKKVLFLCTGNSCRSQMADGIVNHDFAGRLEAHSAGTEPHGLNPKAVRVMAEVGIDISGNSSEHLSKYEGQPFDYVITLCGDANEKCPLFFGGVKRLHMGFEDPASAQGTEEEVMNAFRRVRDEIRRQVREFFENELA
jgi:arsenate reductase